MSQIICDEEKSCIELPNTTHLLARTQYLSEKEWNTLREDRKNFLHYYSKYPTYCEKIYPLIAKSWVRSRSYGVNIQFDMLKQSFLNSQEIQKIQEEHHLLIDYTKQLFTTFKHTLVSGEYSLHLFSKDGILILTDSTVANSSPTLAPARGTIWKEEVIGTNIFSLVCQTKSPSILPGFLHYSEIFTNLTCVAAPILNADSEISGVLAFIQYSKKQPWEKSYQNKMLQALGFITTMAIAVTNMLKNTQALHTVHSDFKTVLNIMDEGILIIDQTGKITKINQVVAQMFKVQATQLIGNNITNFLSAKSRLMVLAKKGQPADLEENIYIGTNEQSCHIKVFPVFNEYDDGDNIDRAVLKISQVKEQNTTTAQKFGFTAMFSFEDLIGESKEFCTAIELGKRFSNSSENILITGESGTGKELFAQAIHNSYRPNGSFVAVNCAAMPTNLIESELFGYEGGSFTGAERGGRPGKIELANGGTLFLDEIGDMSFEVQATLLRVLEDKRVMRIGGQRYINIDFRMIAATNRDLYKMVKNGEFREDLFFRLSILNINIPPLRQRGNDVMILAKYFIEKHCSKLKKQTPQLGLGTLKKIKEYHWPGNVRQLENAFICALATEQSDVIEPESLPAYIALDSFSKTNDKETLRKKMDGEFSLVNWEKNALEAAMSAANNYIPLAADLLQISKSTMYRKLKIFNMYPGAL